MARKDIIIMKMKELKRVPVIHSVISKQITQQEAANILGLCRRQIIRIAAKVKQDGEIAVIHKSRGRLSNRAKPEKLKNSILDLCRTKHKGFGPALAAEKLFETNKICVHPDALRKWFIEASIEYSKRRAPKQQAYNRYAYGRNNPIRYTDPTGHSFWDKVKTGLGMPQGLLWGQWPLQQ